MFQQIHRFNALCAGSGFAGCRLPTHAEVHLRVSMPFVQAVALRAGWQHFPKISFSLFQCPLCRQWLCGRQVRDEHTKEGTNCFNALCADSGFAGKEDKKEPPKEAKVSMPFVQAVALRVIMLMISKIGYLRRFNALCAGSGFAGGHVEAERGR